ncbi:LysM peptidoglycan-binding domain-containing protein [Silvanigrella aquatica]|uniref:LysM domain-containing protein n=1 Tax=Silvanigrella aquatica TaxID=1915309 RepID=A0A1L4D2V6_9BACT|nr:LysM peptidoglycan-binding domain-containing protein [Silvanigrella aquatica]APJ04521.1 hypothetical protein AXG55_11620 [Silvanigrella aquatica]
MPFIYNKLIFILLIIGLKNGVYAKENNYCLHKVKSGDTLSDILYAYDFKFIYGKNGYLQKTYKLNQKIKKENSLIYPNQIIRMPYPNIILCNFYNEPQKDNLITKNKIEKLDIYNKKPEKTNENNMNYNLNSLNLVSTGYSSFTAQSDNYTGYNIYLKSLLALDEEKDIYYGLGFKYENLKASYSNSSRFNSDNLIFKTYQFGLDLLYRKYNNGLDFYLNPYLYYTFNLTWERETYLNNNTLIAEKIQPSIMCNFGLATSALYRFSNFYIGPSFIYSIYYIDYSLNNNYNSNFNYKHYEGTSGLIIEYEINLTLGYTYEF